MPLSPTVSYTYPVTKYDIVGNYTARDNSGHSLSGTTSSPSMNTFYTNAGHDYLKGFDGNDSLYAGGGNDIIEGGGHDDTVSGDSGDDWLYGDYKYESTFAQGNDYLVGGAGNDYLFGAGGNDRLLGGTENDILEGGTGNDRLTGGSGADIFRFDVNAEMKAGSAASQDDILDFQDGVDKIYFVGSSNLTQLDLYDNADNGSYLIANGSHIIYLQGVDASLISSDDFILA